MLFLKVLKQDGNIEKSVQVECFINMKNVSYIEVITDNKLILHVASDRLVVTDSDSIALIKSHLNIN